MGAFTKVDFLTRQGGTSCGARETKASSVFSVSTLRHTIFEQ